MTNFFDIATPEEVTARFSLDATPLTLEELAEERAYLEQDSDANCEQLAGLYVDRGDYAKAQTTLESISDEVRKADTARMLGHDAKYLEWLEARN